VESGSAQTSGQLVYEPIDQKHAESALELVLSRYERERAHVPALPPGAEFRDWLRHAIEGLFGGRCGIAALADGRLVGFLSAYEADELFGRCAGVYVPVYGHGVADGYGSRLYQELYARAADLWIARVDGEPLGYIRIEPDGESFVSRHPSVMNITGAYVVEGRRGSGVGVSLLAELQQWLIQNGYKLCGVDFESINTLGSRFWTRRFTPYTYSMVRRIDERILEHL